MCAVGDASRPGALAEYSEGADKLEEEPKPDYHRCGNARKKPEEEDADAVAREEQGVPGQHAGYGTGCAETRDEKIRAEPQARKDMSESRANPREQVEQEEGPFPHSILDVVAKNHEVEHVSQEVRETTVHKHRGNERQVDGNRRRLEAWNAKPGVRKGVHVHATRCDYVPSLNDLLRHSRKCVGKLRIRTHFLEKNEHQDVDRYEEIGDDRDGRSSAVIVPEGYHSPTRGYANARTAARRCRF